MKLASVELKINYGIGVFVQKYMMLLCLNFSDFVCEKTEGGLRLTEYKGHQTEIYIPERIGTDPVVEISAIFDNAEKIYIPKTVKRILPWIPEHDTYEDLLRGEPDQASMQRLAECLAEGYQSPGCV